MECNHFWNEVAKRNQRHITMECVNCGKAFPTNVKNPNFDPALEKADGRKTGKQSEARDATQAK